MSRNVKKCRGPKPLINVRDMSNIIMRREHQKHGRGWTDTRQHKARDGEGVSPGCDVRGMGGWGRLLGRRPKKREQA